MKEKPNFEEMSEKELANMVNEVLNIDGYTHLFVNPKHVKLVDVIEIISGDEYRFNHSVETVSIQTEDGEILGRRACLWIHGGLFEKSSSEWFGTGETMTKALMIAFLNYSNY